MHRALFKILATLAVALGLTFASTGLLPAQAAPAPAASPVVAAAATSDCTTQQSAYSQSNTRYTNKANEAAAAKRALNRAKAAVAKAKKAVKKAKGKKAKKRAKAKLTKAQRTQRRAAAKYDRARRSAATARTENNQAKSRWTECQTQTTGPASSPVQALCDGGVPQEICDLLGTLIPSGSASNPIGVLCLSVPQAQPLCDLLEMGGGTASTDDILGVIEGLLGDLGLTDFLAGVLSDLGIGDLLELTGLDNLLDLLGLGGLIP